MDVPMQLSQLPSEADIFSSNQEKALDQVCFSITFRWWNHILVLSSPIQPLFSRYAGFGSVVTFLYVVKSFSQLFVASIDFDLRQLQSTVVSYNELDNSAVFVCICNVLRYIWCRVCPN